MNRQPLQMTAEKKSKSHMYFEPLRLSFEIENKNTLKIKSPFYCGDNIPLTPYVLTSATKTKREMKNIRHRL